MVVLAAFVVIWLQIRWMKGMSRSFEPSAISTVTSIIDSQTLRVFCDNCEGTGIIREPANPEHIDVCPVCFGLGLHRMRQLGRLDMLCATCGGMGRLADEAYGQAHVCPSCEGRGMVSAPREIFRISAQKARCQHCGGRGGVRNEETMQLELCPVCFGLGDHLVRRMDGYDKFCPNCDGMGRLFDEALGTAVLCEDCRGRGLVLGRAIHEALGTDEAPAGE
jgi:DnaJ-class molecular chaperone